MTLTEIIQTAWEQVQHNDFFTGGFVLGILAWTGHQLRHIPMAIWRRIDRRIRHVVYFDNTNNIYGVFTDWYREHYPDKFRRVEARLRIEHEEGRGHTSIGFRQFNDINILWWKGRLLYIQKEKETLENANSRESLFIEKYTISGFFARKAINALLEECRSSHQRKKDEWHGVHLIQYDGYASRHKYIQGFKHLNQLYVDGVEELLRDLDTFTENEDFYTKRGVRYKRGYLFYGPPGTGKTSLCVALAEYLDRSVYYLSLTGMDNSDFKEFINSVRKGSIILIEDVDIVLGGDRRDSSRKEETRVSLQHILNTFDGVHSPHDVIIMMTTNKPDELDEALLRKGRLDYKMLVDYPSRERVEEYVRDFYELRGDVSLEGYRGGIPLVDVQDICMNTIQHAEAIEKIKQL